MNRSIMQYRQILSLIVALFFLSSCGFSPIYKKENNSTYAVLSTIEIAPINSIEGADFYNHLKNIFPYNVASTDYLLTASLSFHKDISVLQENSDALREMIKINVSYELKDKSNSKKILSGNFIRLASFNTTFSPYSNNVYLQEMQKNLAIASAEEVRNRIMLFLENQKH